MPLNIHAIFSKLYHELMFNRIKIEFGQDGSLESRLYLSGAGPGDAGPYRFLVSLND